MARVMIVDDSPTDVHNIKSILTKAGHEVLEATSGQDALDRIKSERPDAVIMDVVMPGVNGFQATRMLSKDPSTASIPIVVISSKNQESDRMWALRQGAKEYVTKPIKDADLLGKLAQALGGK
ncbi:MAG: response regulator [Nevskiaceae bacterium]|jgi:twitching motility two-component system response regulator PilH|nr:MAG: response regulator [Nevskiaceae bacterium]TAM27459.1 MAG: response regulator [Nevskiaceae bacterium]